MAHKHIYPQAIAFAEESTPCVPPGDWTAATAFEFISVDLSGVKESLIVDPTAERRPMRVGERARVPGIRNCTASIIMKLHGVGEETADTMQVENTYLARFLKHCMGQSIRGYSTTIDGPGTTAIPIVAATTGIIPGIMLAFEDTTTPLDRDAGVLQFRRVLAVNTMTKAVTLSEVLGFTPQDGDKVHACITGAYDHDYLCDAVAAGGTMTYFVKRETNNTDDDLLWQLEGCVADMKIENLSRNGLPQLTLDIQAANFRHGAQDGLANVALAVPEGQAQLAMGTNVRLLISPSASNASVEVDMNSVALDIGVARKPTPTQTERINCEKRSIVNARIGPS